MKITDLKVTPLASPEHTPPPRWGTHVAFARLIVQVYTDEASSAWRV